MASLLPALSAPPRLLPSARRRPAATTASCSSCSSSSSAAAAAAVPLASSTLIKLHPPPLGDPKQQQHQKQQQHRRRPPTEDNDNEKGDFFLNLGTAVRTLRDDLPALFSRDLNYDIYRNDITFADPLNTFHGIDNYRLLFWALRFHGRILFKDIGLDVLRIWQLSDDVILIRWNLKGVPRVPWETRGAFQGTSRYKLDRHGKIYEHRVDNLAFNFPKMAPPGSAAILDLVAASACPPVASPNLSFIPRWDPLGEARQYKCSWVEFYRAVKETLDQGDCFVAGMQDGLVTCS